MWVCLDYTVKCTLCGVETMPYEKETEAENAWNTRAAK